MISRLFLLGVLGALWMTQVVAAASAAATTDARLFTSHEELAKVQAHFRADADSLRGYLPPLTGAEAAVVPLTHGVTAQRSMILLARYALAYRVTGNPDYLDALRRWLPEIEGYQPPLMKSIGGHEGLTAGHVLLGAAMVGDFLPGDTDPRVRTAFRTLLLRQASVSYRDLSALKRLPYEQNHLIIPVCGLAIASLAVLEEEPAAHSWLEFSEGVLGKSLRALGGDGWFFEGISYWNYTMQFPICYGLVLKRATGRSIFDVPVFKGGIRYLADMMLPGGDLAFDFADWGPRVEGDGKGFQAGYDLPWHTLPTRPKLFIPLALEREFGATAFSRDLIAFLGTRNRAKSGTNAIDAVFMLLWAFPDPTQPTALASTYHDAPTYHAYPDLGVLHWRENWSDPDALAVAFKAGPPAGHHFAQLLKEDTRWKPSLGHAHPDAGSFILYTGGSFLSGDTGYTGAKETADHTSLLIDGVGQHKGGTPWATFEGKPYDDYAKIALRNTWLNSSVIAATADLTAAYADAMQLQRVERTFFLVAGKYLVVADHLVSTLPHVYEWRWHSDRAAVMKNAQMEIPGSRADLVLKNLRPIESMRVAATLVDTELYAGNAPRLQQRGYHLAATSPSVKEHRFLTAGFVRRQPSDTPEFSVEGNTVLIATPEESCILWPQSGDGLDGTYAFVVRDRTGQSIQAGFQGTSLTLKGDWSVKTAAPASLLLRFDGRSVEITAPDTTLSLEVTMQRFGQTKRVTVGPEAVRLVFD